MKKAFPILLAIAVVFLNASCEKTTPTPPKTVDPSYFAMNFKAMYANKPLVINQVYDYNGKKVRFTRLQFFIAYDLGLFSSPVSVSDNLPSTALVKFTNLTDSASAAGGVDVELALANKSWPSLNFAIGVPKVQNAKLPKDFVFPDPLTDGSNFWDAWQSYIFSKLEGSMDKDGDGVFETGITLHTGGNEVFTPVKFTKNYTVANGSKTIVNFELNINELVKGIDLTTVNSSHQVGDAATMRIIMNNFPTALTVK
jgi:hypothetical protein